MKETLEFPPYLLKYGRSPYIPKTEREKEQAVMPLIRFWFVHILPRLRKRCPDDAVQESFGLRIGSGSHVMKGVIRRL
jgi:hypothetical protein